MKSTYLGFWRKFRSVKFLTAKKPYGENSARKKFRSAKIPYGENSVRQKFLWRKFRRRKFHRRKFRSRLTECRCCVASFLAPSMGNAPGYKIKLVCDFLIKKIEVKFCWSILTEAPGRRLYNKN